MKIRKDQPIVVEDGNWSRPNHIIERNIKATEKGKTKRKALK